MVTISDATLRQGKSMPGRSNPNWRTDIKTPEVVGLYEQGLSITLISNVFGCDRKAIKNRLDEWGVDVREQSFYLKENKRTSGEKNARWSGGTDQYWKQKLIDKRGYACESCGFDVQVQVHHIDENRKNNKEENLLLVCPNCHFCHHHSKTHKLIKKGKKWSLSKI